METSNNNILTLKNFNKKFDDTLILKNINFNLDKGQILSILGPSGAGKTTLLRCIIGLDKKNVSGEIFINNCYNIKYLENYRIAFVPQQYSNFEWLNVYDNVILGIQNNIYWKQKTNQEKHTHILNVIEKVGLSGFEKFYINKLSGGMQQRVSIARALAQDTEIIAFDEPFSALDFKVREDLQLLIKKLNKTIIFVTHDIEEALFISDKIIVLSKIPTQIIIEYLPKYRNNFDGFVKFDESFIQFKKNIQLNLS